MVKIKKSIKKSIKKKQKQTFNKLYDPNKNPEQSIQGTGYANKKKALETLKIIKGEPIVKQKQIVITMYYRAKHHQNRTRGMLEAMKTFEPWMKKHNIKTSSQPLKSKKSKKSKTIKIANCCKSSSKDKICRRIKDNKVFKLPRRFSKKDCKSKKVKGYSMISSCAPYKYC
jgi:hypothetical protein